MIGVVLLASGLVGAAYGSWRGYRAAQAALMPLVRNGDETRTLIEATRPIHARSRVRAMARHGTLAVAWITVAMYGLYLLTTGAAVLR
jgi:hypothetical protein